MTHAFIAVVFLATAAGVSRIVDLPGCWEYTVGPWRLALNGHPERCAATWGPSVGPFAVMVEFNGLPAGIITAVGGVLMTSSATTEAAFIKAMEAETRRLGGMTADEAKKADAAESASVQTPLFPELP